MKIYFAGSITGGRADQGLYFEIVEQLRDYGTVLTEHIADVALSHLGQQEADQIIYDRDTSWIREADVLVAEVTTPSLGVGYEIGLAESLGKQVLCLHRSINGRRTSPMLLGNAQLVTKEYTDVSELGEVFEKFFAGVRSSLRPGSGQAYTSQESGHRPNTSEVIPSLTEVD